MRQKEWKKVVQKMFRHSRFVLLFYVDPAIVILLGVHTFKELIIMCMHKYVYLMLQSTVIFWSNSISGELFLFLVVEIFKG